MRILIAVDGSGNAGIVLEAVAPWLRQTDGQAQILTVLDASEIEGTQQPMYPEAFTPLGTWAGSAISIDAPGSRTVEDRSQAIARIEGEVRDRLAGLAAQHLSGVDCDLRVTVAEDAAQGIVMAASDWGADVIALATHGRAGLQRLLLGSIAEAVVRQSPIPVILIRAGVRER